MSRLINDLGVSWGRLRSGKGLHHLLAGGLALGLCATVQAAVEPEAAAKLGTSLTRTGADPKANTDGSIPAYSGGLTSAPAGFTAGDTYQPNPYANDKPLLVIDGTNIDQYQNQVTATVAALARRFPGFRMDIYPSRRSLSLPKAVLDNTRLNALNALSTKGGITIENVLPGIAFPIPASGSEAMWNHLLRYQGVTASAKFDNWNVSAAGDTTLVVTAEGYLNWPIYEDMSRPLAPDDTYYRLKMKTRFGFGQMVEDAVNPILQPRRAWVYVPGLRRLKRMPEMAYGEANPGTKGVSTFDDTFVFSGALDGYDWKLVGKQEMYVPYNAYDFVFNKDPEAIVTPNHIAPAIVRWEKHRVWVVEATLKPGRRHIYHKRRFYLDEDSWIALASDEYDAGNQLFRGSLAFTTQNYEQQLMDGTTHMIYDLINGGYGVNGMTGAYGGVKHIEKPLHKSQWLPASLKATAIR